MKQLALTSAVIFNLAFSANAEQHNIDQIETAARAANTTSLIQLSNDLQGYDKAFATYRLALSTNFEGDQNKADEALNQSVAILNQTLEQTSDSQEQAEINALLAQVYGLKVAFSPMKGMVYGPLANSALSKAKSLDVNNPRVYLVEGISKYNTPTMFGGSKPKAVEALTKAIELYETDAQSGFHWGYSEAHVWLGLAKMDLGDKQAAVDNWHKAVELAPDFGWAQVLLKKATQ